MQITSATQKDLGLQATLSENTFALAMEVDGEKVACGIFSMDENLVTLEDLFVLPFHEGRGYGRYFISELSKSASQNYVGQMFWSHSSFIEQVAPFKASVLQNKNSNALSA